MTISPSVQSDYLTLTALIVLMLEFDVKCTEASNLFVKYSNVRGNCELLRASLFCVCVLIDSLTLLDCTPNMVQFLRKTRIRPLQKPFLDFILSKHGCSVESLWY
jgi:hypothetical protein